MSGASVMLLVRKRLLISHKIEIVLDNLETQELDREIERELGKELTCPQILDAINKKSDEELMELVKKIRKKKKVLAGVS